MSELENEKSTLATINSSIFYQVSPRKLIALSIITMGLFTLYWFYKQWAYVRDNRNDGSVNALLRVLFLLFYFYPLLKEINCIAKEHLVVPIKRVWLLTIAFIVLGVIEVLPTPLTSLAVCLYPIFLWPMQKVINRINVANLSYQDNASYGNWDFMLILVGLAIWSAFINDLFS